MPKRFTDTDKWKKPFIRALSAPYKLLWFYILDDCDHAGIWQADFEVASIRIGYEVNETEMIKNFGDKVEKIGTMKFFIPDFIFFQYGELNEKNRLHLSVIHILKKHNIKPLRSPLEGAKDKDKDKDKEQDKEIDETYQQKNALIIPEMAAMFKRYLPQYPSSPSKDYKPLYAIATYFLEIGKKSGTPDQHKDDVLEAWEPICQSIANDNFYKQKSLSTISNHIQEITQNALYGKSVTKGKQSGATMEGLQRELEKRLNKERQASN